MKIQHLLLIFSLFASFSLFANENDPCYYDTTPPWMACDYHTVVTLGSNGVGTAYAETFDDGSTDNCGIQKFEVRRMFQGWCGPGVDDDTQFGPYVQFCCEDLTGGSIWVVLKATDFKGNSNTCMVEVTVQDGGTVHFQCPPDIEVSCGYWFNESELWNPYGHFGTIVGYGQPQNPIWISDPGNPYVNDPHLWGYDGYAGGGSACGGGGGWGTPWVSIQEVIDLRNSCGVGKIRRKFFVEYGGWTDWCWQTIWVKDYTTSNYGITWPKDYFVDDCTSDLTQYDPNVLSPPYNKPIVGNGGYGSCNMIGYAYEDLVFTFAPGACYKILREWTVIDWCKYDPQHPWYGGIWKHTQVIKITNSHPPVFIDHCPDVVVEGVESDCSGRFIKNYEVTDDCTPTNLLKYDYKIDLYSNGSYDIKVEGVGQPHVNRVLPFGWHKILISVQDQCGNYSTCSHKIQVVDRKKPTPVCLHGISSVVMPIGGMVTIWAKEFNVSSEDNCTPAHKLKFSFGPNGQDMSRIFTCDDIGTVPLQIYVTDEFNNTQYCSTFIRIDDNEGTCDDMNRIEGTVSTFDGIPIPGAEIDLFKIMPNSSLKDDHNTKLSNELGQFETGFGTTSYNRQLIVEREGNPLEGISTLDLIALQRHILGIEKIELPEQLLAADVDGSGHVGVMDLITLRNILLGAPLETANLGWYFFEQSCTWEQPEDIFSMECSNGYQINQNNSFPMAVHFNAVKMGDVNFDLTNTAWHVTTRSATTYSLLIEKAENGILNFVASKEFDAFGMQFSLPMPESEYDLIDGVISMNQSNVRVDDQNELNVSWAKKEVSIIKEGDVLFSISMNEVENWISDLNFNNAGLQPEIYNEDREAINLQIQLSESLKSTTPEFENFDAVASPNPFGFSTTLNVQSPIQSVAELNIYNEVGAVVLNRELNLIKGNNAFTVTERELSTDGLYYYQVLIKETNDQLSGKLIKF